MSSATYTKFELLRTFRNRRFFLFSLGFPLVLYYLIAGPKRQQHNLDGTGLSAPLYYMVGLAAFGTMSVVISPAPDRRRAPGRLEPPAAAHARCRRAPTSAPRC